MTTDKHTSLALFILGLLLMAIVLAACGGGGGGTPNVLLTVVTSGTGTVTSSPEGITCGTDCTHEYPQGTLVTLTATPSDGATFAGWSGDCTGATCVVTMDGAKSVTATFEAPDTGHEKLISGTVEDWTGGAATVRAEILTGTGDTGGPVLAEGTIDASGAFSLTLPGAETMGQYLFPIESGPCGEGSTGTIEVTPSPLEIAVPAFSVYSSADDAFIGFLAQVGVLPGSYVGVSQFYSALSGTVQGSCTIEGEGPDGEPLTYTLIYALDLEPGWNDVISESAGFDTNIRTGAIPAGVSWQYLDNSSPPPPPGPPVGDISGTVTVPEGEDVSGTEVRACAPDYRYWCSELVVIEASGASASYTIPDLPAARYEVEAIKGVEQGVLLGCYGDGTGFDCELTLVEPPQTNVDIIMTFFSWEYFEKPLRLHPLPRLFRSLWHHTF